MTPDLVAVVGPSGAGKDTLMEAACAGTPGIRAVRRVITRPTKAGGEDFEGISEAEFDRRLSAGDFALTWAAHGLRYGLPKSELTGGGTLLFNASRAVLEEAARLWPGLRVVRITAPPEVLAARLAGRGREDAQDQARRVARASFALPEGIRAVTVVNDADPATGLQRFLAALEPVRG
ncbi:phosphonate metabolism protein/1,5-bisphosphokinase (PRPP-forming) PhnN [Falsigemmobacter faecalis]|uniref:Ribose 1,5-bisphosphate phosphokinase PhnN n=1 Tax=Falsigemmobacter faecalis TaxID=2488730 RepID=A0A3P3DQT7_9RHOB|nr:phosphonate metabolism protein/1,5-bisphosphokinase (PRPP-forming) PhnN [Falsigemmobacter faecalis]RRH76633.1 phosphonate metabolism protein/1,5-bisphosphokinase (PRPP-forming) PhnN [Falsigemmobacter faecalis]